MSTNKHNRNNISNTLGASRRDFIKSGAIASFASIIFSTTYSQGGIITPAFAASNHSATNLQKEQITKTISSIVSNADGKRKLRVLTTTAQIADVIRNIAPDLFEVTSLMGEGIDPHSYLPTRRDIRELSKADIVLSNGLHLEGKMVTLLDSIARQKPSISAVDLIRSEINNQNIIDEFDPHVWMDVELWIKFTTAIKSVMVKAYQRSASDHKNQSISKIQDASERYISRLNSINEYGKNTSSTLPPSHRIMITSHDAFRYFGKRYDMEVMGIQGISSANEPSLKDIERIVSVVVERKIPSIFFESSTNGRYVQAIIEGAKAKGGIQVQVAGPLFSDSMGAHGSWEGTYIGMMDHNFTKIVASLGGNVPHRGYAGMLNFNSGSTTI